MCGGSVIRPLPVGIRFQERDHRLDLRAHAAGQEVPLLCSSSFASLSVITSSHFWSGLLKLIATFSTAVLM